MFAILNTTDTRVGSVWSLPGRLSGQPASTIIAAYSLFDKSTYSDNTQYSTLVRVRFTSPSIHDASTAYTFDESIGQIWEGSSVAFGSVRCIHNSTGVVIGLAYLASQTVNITMTFPHVDSASSTVSFNMSVAREWVGTICNAHILVYSGP